MIKDLIIDIVYDKISVSQGLTRAKLIARQIKNETFQNWLSRELNGYEYEDIFLPEYRKISAEIELTVEFPYGRIQTFPVVLAENFNKKIEDMIYNHRVVEPIAIIEQTVEQMKEGKGYIFLNGGMVKLVGELYIDQIEAHGGAIKSGKRTVGKAQYSNIIELTKQKLIDTLQDLDEEFPEMDNKYVMNKANIEKVQNIITNNIYGNNNPLNVAAGQNIDQGDITVTINEITKEKLKEFGIEENEIQELEILEKDNPKGTSNRKIKIMGWLGKVTASLAAKGIYENIPAITEFIAKLI